MQCVLVFYLVATIFVAVYSMSDLCEFKEHYGEKIALCGRDHVKFRFDFIPLISQYVSLIDLTQQPLKQLPYNAFRNLSSQSSISQIMLRDCQLSHVDAGALLNLHKLTIIDLSCNFINQIDSTLFSDTKQMKYIYLQANKIEVLPSGLFQNLTLLEIVYLSDNRIRQVEWYSFKNTPSLGIIDLSNNQIESMHILFKDNYDNLTQLTLGGNPWKCNYELGPLYELLININQLNEQELVCEKPPTLQGRQWSDISRDKFVRRSEDAISTQDSVMTSAESMTTIEEDDNITVADFNGTRYQQVYTGIPQSPSNQNWILYTILCFVLVWIATVIIGVVLLKRRSFRRPNVRNVDSDLPMLVVQSSAVSESGNLALNMAVVDEEQTSFHHDEIHEATIN